MWEGECLGRIQDETRLKPSSEDDLFLPLLPSEDDLFLPLLPSEDDLFLPLLLLLGLLGIL